MTKTKTQWKTVTISRIDLMGLIADHVEAKNVNLKVDRASILGILSIGQPEDEECWLSDSGVEVTFAAVASDPSSKTTS